MKITRTFELDSKGIEIGDKIYIFKTETDDYLDFYTYDSFIITNITISNSAHINTELVVSWENPKLGLQQHSLFDFINFDERENSFNFYVVDKEDRVAREIEKRKQYVKNKLIKDIESSKNRISINTELLNLIYN